MEKILELEKSKKKLIINIDDKVKTKKYKKLTEFKFNSKWAYASYISFAIVIIMYIFNIYSNIMFLGFYGLIFLFSVLSVIFINKDTSVFLANLYNQDVNQIIQQILIMLEEESTIPFFKCNYDKIHNTLNYYDKKGIQQEIFLPKYYIGVEYNYWDKDYAKVDIKEHKINIFLPERGEL